MTVKRVVILLLPVLFLLVSCNKAWRGDGPPGTVAGTVWIGTNEARGEILEIRFLLSEDVSYILEEDGSSTETGESEILFTSPAADVQGVRDTVYYSGSYTYSRWPSTVAGDVYHGQVRFTLTGENGAVREAVMVFHNMRFYFEFKDSPGAWPADPADGTGSAY